MVKMRVAKTTRYLETDVIEAEADGAPKIERQQFMLRAGDYLKR